MGGSVDYGTWYIRTRHTLREGLIIGGRLYLVRTCRVVVNGQKLKNSLDTVV